MTRHTTPSTRDALLAGLLVSLITAGVLVRLRFSSLDGPLAEAAGALSGAIFIPVAVCQLAVLRLRPTLRKLSPLLVHAVLVPCAAALGCAAALLVGSSWLLATVRGASLEAANCASFEQLIGARWSPGAGGEPALVAALPDGSNILFNVEAGRPICKTAPPPSRR